MSDSTNALRPGFTPSETKVAKTFDTLFAEHKKRRIIVATFASNVDRVQQLINTATSTLEGYPSGPEHGDGY